MQHRHGPRFQRAIEPCSSLDCPQTRTRTASMGPSPNRIRMGISAARGRGSGSRAKNIVWQGADDVGVVRDHVTPSVNECVGYGRPPGRRACSHACGCGRKETPCRMARAKTTGAHSHDGVRSSWDRCSRSRCTGDGRWWRAAGQMHAGVCIIVRGRVKGVTHRDDGLGYLHGTSTVNSASPVHCPKGHSGGKRQSVKCCDVEG